MYITQLIDKLSFCKLLRCCIHKQKSPALSETIQRQLLEKILEIEKELNKRLDASGAPPSLEKSAEPEDDFNSLSNTDLYQILVNKGLLSPIALDQCLVLANNNLVNYTVVEPLHDCAYSPESIEYAHYFLRARLIDYVKRERELLSQFTSEEMGKYLSDNYPSWMNISQIMPTGGLFEPKEISVAASDDEFNQTMKERIPSAELLFFSPPPPALLLAGIFLEPKEISVATSYDEFNPAMKERIPGTEPLFFSPPPALPLIDEGYLGNSFNCLL